MIQCFALLGSIDLCFLVYCVLSTVLRAGGSVTWCTRSQTLCLHEFRPQSRTGKFYPFFTENSIQDIFCLSKYTTSQSWVNWYLGRNLLTEVFKHPCPSIWLLSPVWSAVADEFISEVSGQLVYLRVPGGWKTPS